MHVVSTQETEVRELLEPKSSRPAWLVVIVNRKNQLDAIWSHLGDGPQNVLVENYLDSVK